MENKIIIGSYQDEEINSFMLLEVWIIDQTTIDQLINELKRLIYESKYLELPKRKQKVKYEATSSHNLFIIDINRQGRRDYLTLQMRHGIKKNKVLVRLDLTGPSHTNPRGDYPLAGKKIPCPHMHIAKEGYDDRIAYPLDHEYVKMFFDKDELNDLVKITKNFLNYINIGNINSIIVWEQKSLEI